MKRKKIIVSILGIGLLVMISVVAIKYYNTYNANQSETSVRVLGYTEPNVSNEKNYKIDKYENVENVAWLNENEVLTLTKKANSNIVNIRDPLDPLFSCSIYNLNTKNSKDYEDVNIGKFRGVSPDNKYVLYNEYSEIEKDILKLLNLSTGEITEINSELNDSSSEYKWISNNKILTSLNNRWGIIDIYGKVYAEGEEFGSISVIGVDDIKDLGDGVEGEFYINYTEYSDSVGKVKICSIDVKTNKVKTINYNQYEKGIDKKGKTITAGSYTGNTGIYTGIWETNLEVKIMDKDGDLINNIKSSEGTWLMDVVLSPDGSKAAYVETENNPLMSYVDPNSKQLLKVIDTKTGDIKEILNSTSIIDDNTEGKIPNHFCNITWNSTGTALSLTNGYGREGIIFKKKINTYIVSFDN